MNQVRIGSTRLHWYIYRQSLHHIRLLLKPTSFLVERLWKIQSLLYLTTGKKKKKRKLTLLPVGSPDQFANINLKATTTSSF